MAHDVYLSYDEKDLETALNVCETLESNGLKCWMKNRDVDDDNRVRAIIKAIKQTRVLLLIHSKNSKSSKFINNEVNEAFDADKSFLVYYIDDSKLEGGLEYFLKTKPSVNAYPNPEEKNDILIKLTKNLVKKQKRQDGSIKNIINKNKKAVAIGVIALVVLVAAVGFMMFNGNGTAFLDAGGGLWVIDYKYSEKEQMPFLRPSYGKTEQTDEYQRELSKLGGADLFIQDDKGKRNGKKGILARLFGWMK